MLYIESQVDEAIARGKKSTNRVSIWFMILILVLFIGIMLFANHPLGIYTNLLSNISIFAIIGSAFWLLKHKKRRWKHWVTGNFQDPKVLYLIERRAIENGLGTFDDLTQSENPKQAITHTKPRPSLPPKTVFGKSKKRIVLKFVMFFGNWLLCLLGTVGVLYFTGQKGAELLPYAIALNIVVAGATIFVFIRNYRIYKSPQNLLEISAQGIWSKSRKKLGVISWEHIRQFAFYSPMGSKTNYHIYLIFTPAYAQSIGKKQLHIDTQLIELPKDKQNLETLFNQYQYLYWHKTPVNDEQ
jgi:hypothetical protein